MRPKTFDQTEALDAAMLQFWEAGYEGSSMQNLVDRMGISRQSLYDTYGNKRELFEASLERYRSELIAPGIAAIKDPARTPLEAVRFYLTAAAEGGNGMPIGCLMVRTATEFSPEDAAISAIVGDCVRDVRDALRARIDEGQRSGEIDAIRSADDVAGAIVAWGMGLQVMRRLPRRGEAIRPSIDSLLTTLVPDVAEDIA